MSHSLSSLLLLYAQQFEDQHAPQNMTIALREAAAEIERLRKRLEVAPTHPHDGIYCRDETIRLQDAQIAALKAEVEQLREELNARCPIDAMDRGMSIVEAAIYHVWGERCPDFEPGCLTCNAWAEFDQIERLRAALKKIVEVRSYRKAEAGELFEIARAALTTPEKTDGR